MYGRREFEAAGIRHRDLYFDDCTVPDDDTVSAAPPSFPLDHHDFVVQPTHCGIRFLCLFFIVLWGLPSRRADPSPRHSQHPFPPEFSRLVPLVAGARSPESCRPPGA